MTGTLAQNCVLIAEHQRSALQSAIELISAGRVIALATDTIYGLAASALEPSSVSELYRIKTRNPLKPLAICVGDICDLEHLCELTISHELLSQLLPGPVTLVFRRSSQLHPHINPDTNLVGIRIPDHNFIRSLARHCGPLALTSANISNRDSSLRVEEFRELWPQLSAVFDAGPLGEVNERKRAGSTVIDLSQKGYYKILREGCANQRTEQVLNRHSLSRLL